MQGILQTGAGCRIAINSNVVGFATGLTWTRSLGTKTIFELDNPHAREIMPTTYSVSGTMTGFRARGSGGLDGYNIMNSSTAASFFNQKYCVIEVVDILSGVTIASFQKVVFDTDSWTLANKQMITFSANFKAVFVSNEASTNNA